MFILLLIPPLFQSILMKTQQMTIMQQLPMIIYGDHVTSRKKAR